MLVTAMNNVATPSTVGEWVMDLRATTHMAYHPCMLQNLTPLLLPQLSPLAMVLHFPSLTPAKLLYCFLSFSYSRQCLNSSSYCQKFTCIRRFTIDNL